MAKNRCLWLCLHSACSCSDCKSIDLHIDSLFYLSHKEETFDICIIHFDFFSPLVQIMNYSLLDLVNSIDSLDRLCNQGYPAASLEHNLHRIKVRNLPKLCNE